jgi:hypothetical protein
MPFKNTAITVCYVAWDTSANVGKTGDSANHTIRGVGDGSEYTPAASPSEVDLTNLPGVYKIAIASGENNYSFVTLGGKSSTANIVLIPVYWTNEVNANAVQILGTAVSSPATAGILDVNIKNIANAVVNTANAQIGANVVTQANIDFGTTQKASITAAVPTVGAIQSGLATPTNITAGIITTVSGNVTGSVGSVAAGGITAASFASKTLKPNKNTLLNNFEFLMVLTSDHVTPGTGLTVAAQRSIDGGAFGACTNSPTEISNGWYKINLSAADLNGDVIALLFTSATADNTNILIFTES